MTDEPTFELPFTSHFMDNKWYLLDANSKTVLFSENEDVVRDLENKFNAKMNDEVLQ